MQLTVYYNYTDSYDDNSTTPMKGITSGGAIYFPSHVCNPIIYIYHIYSMLIFKIYTLLLYRLRRRIIMKERKIMVH